MDSDHNTVSVGTTCRAVVEKNEDISHERKHSDAFSQEVPYHKPMVTHFAQKLEEPMKFWSAVNSPIIDKTCIPNSLPANLFSNSTKGVSGPEKEQITPEFLTSHMSTDSQNNSQAVTDDLIGQCIQETASRQPQENTPMNVKENFQEDHHSSGSNSSTLTFQQDSRDPTDLASENLCVYELENVETAAKLSCKTGEQEVETEWSNISLEREGGSSDRRREGEDQLGSVTLFGCPIICLYMEGKERLCLAQISNTLLQDFSYNEIHNRRVALGITCLQCTPLQLELLRRAGAMPISSRRCGLITKREAERLVKSFISDIPPPRLPNNFTFKVRHQCGYGCDGLFVPSRYNSSRAKCIKCCKCDSFFSPNKFVFHFHTSPDAIYRHPDAANFNSWRRHLELVNTDDDQLVHAWEDVKAMFNGGCRKRFSPSFAESLSAFKACSSRMSTKKSINSGNTPSARISKNKISNTREGTKNSSIDHNSFLPSQSTVDAESKRSVSSLATQNKTSYFQMTSHPAGAGVAEKFPTMTSGPNLAYYSPGYGRIASYGDFLRSMSLPYNMSVAADHSAKHDDFAKWQGYACLSGGFETSFIDAKVRHCLQYPLNTLPSHTAYRYGACKEDHGGPGRMNYMFLPQRPLPDYAGVGQNYERTLEMNNKGSFLHLSFPAITGQTGGSVEHYSQDGQVKNLLEYSDGSARDLTDRNGEQSERKDLGDNSGNQHDPQEIAVRYSGVEQRAVREVERNKDADLAVDSKQTSPPLPKSAKALLRMFENTEDLVIFAHLSAGKLRKVLRAAQYKSMAVERESRKIKEMQRLQRLRATELREEFSRQFLTIKENVWADIEKERQLRVTLEERLTEVRADFLPQLTGPPPSKFPGFD